MPGFYALGEQALGGLTGELIDYQLGAEAGSYLFTGHVAGLSATRHVQADADSYELVGHGSPLATRRIESGSGVYTLTGYAARFDAARWAEPDAGAYDLTCSVVDLTAARYSAGELGSYLTAGFGAVMQAKRILRPSVMPRRNSHVLFAALGEACIGGSAGDAPTRYALFGQPVRLVAARMPADVGVYATTGFAPEIYFRAMYEAKAAPITLQIAGFDFELEDGDLM